MKKLLAFVSALSLAAIVGCQSFGSQGGSGANDEGFKIAVPGTETDIKQGETQNVTVTVQRGDYFKQDVKLEIRTTAGVTVDPTSLLVKASDKPDQEIRVSATKDAPLTDCHIYVTATPTTGQPSIADFVVKIVAP